MHRVIHVLAEISVLGVLVFPLAIGFAVLVGLASSILVGYEEGLDAAWITWLVTMAVVPLALRLTWGPDTRAICSRCLAWMERQVQQRTAPVRKEHRRYPRYAVALSATFFNARTSGLARVGNISAGGCRVTSRVAMACGEFGQLLIDLPGAQAPLKVSEAVVRWVTGNECGIEFIRVDADEQGWLQYIIEQLSLPGQRQDTPG